MTGPAPGDLCGSRFPLTEGTGGFSAIKLRVCLVASKAETRGERVGGQPDRGEKEREGSRGTWQPPAGVAE